ncbi:hypothetical protein EV359DRAFT_68684, partial [Lentinula novae-zelandiae]
MYSSNTPASSPKQVSTTQNNLEQNSTKVRLVSVLDTDTQQAEIHKLQIQLAHLGTRHNILMRALTNHSPSLPLEVKQRDQAMSKFELENLIGPSQGQCDHYDARKFAVEVILYAYETSLADISRMIDESDVKTIAKNDLKQDSNRKLQQLLEAKKYITQLKKIIDGYETQEDGRDELKNQLSLELDILREDMKNLEVSAEVIQFAHVQSFNESQKSHHKLETDLQSQEAELQHLQSTLLARDGEDNNLKNQIQALRQKLSNMREERVLKDWLEKLQGMFHDRDAELKTTASTLQLTESHCAELTDELTVTSSHSKAMENQILHLQSELARLQAVGLVSCLASSDLFLSFPELRFITYT